MKTKDNSSEAKKAGSQKAASNIVLCFFASFGVFFFIPMDLFLANAGDIAFPLKPLAIFMGIVTLAVFAVLFLVCMLTKGKANNILRAIVLGTSTAFYIQGNFLAVNMGLLNGSEYDLPIWKAALNIAIWLVIMAIPFFILVKFPNVFDSAVSYIPAAILLIQIFTLCISPFLNMSKYGTGNIVEIFYGDTRWINTTASLDTYSENKNLIIILADEYCSFAFDDAIADDPDAVSEFDGFTYYTNTVGKFGLTYPSLGYIFTADKDASYSDLTFLETVSKNYKANFYCDTVVPPAQVFSKYSDNIILKKITLGETRGYASSIYRISFFRCMPEILKPLFWSSGDIGQELISKTAKKLDLTNGVSEYSYNNIDFYVSMPSELKSTDENVFKFLYIHGLHDPRTATRDLERAPENERVSTTDEAVAVNKIVNKYLKILKNNGVYDNSEIIFMADHGHYRDKKYLLLMYKPAAQTESGIKISNAPISYDDIFPTLVMLAGGEPNARTIFDIGENEERVRYYGENNEEITGNIKQDPQ